MRYLLISDLHGNHEALDSVLKDAGGQYDRIVCCGDLVGYGPDPNTIVDWARANLFAVIRGNHDRACCGLDDLEWFNPVAQEASRWTMSHLSAENLDWLRSLKRGPIHVDSFSLAHGSPLDEDEYITSLSEAANVFEYLDRPVTFFGHTHLQGGFLFASGRRDLIAHPHRTEYETLLHIDADALYLINPGSTGQPRDSDARAAYALFDTETQDLLLRRISYDHEAVRNKIVRAGLPPALGHRLAFGR